MVEHPILFSGPMVRAILEGRKSQTRRVIKPQPAGDDLGVLEQAYDGTFDVDGYWLGLVAGDMGYDSTTLRCPYGIPGDRLWVREKWAPFPAERPAGYWAPGSHFYGREAWYWADNDRPTWGGPWKPSIHMPKRLCRLWLEVKAVRVERVQEISEDDAELEGIDCYDYEDEVTGDVRQAYMCETFQGDRPSEVFRQLWDSINLKRGFGWESNPWVWVVDYMRTEAKA